MWTNCEQIVKKSKIVEFKYLLLFCTLFGYNVLCQRKEFVIKINDDENQWVSLMDI